MTRLLATTALLGALLAMPAWAQTMTTPAHHHARHAIHHAGSAGGSASSEAHHRHRFVAGDNSAEMLNRQVLRNLQNGD